MSIIYNDTQDKSELQRRILAELREKQAQTSLNNGDSTSKSADESAEVEEAPKSASLRWLVMLLVLGLLIAGLIYMVKLQG